MLKYNAAAFQGGATVSDLENSIATQGQGTARIQGVTSGATATMFRFNTSLQYLHIENISGNFENSEIITIEKEDSSTFQVQLDEVLVHCTTRSRGLYLLLNQVQLH